MVATWHQARGIRVVALWYQRGVTLVAIWWHQSGIKFGVSCEELPINENDKIPKTPQAPYEVSLKRSSISPSEWAYRATGDRYGAVSSTPDGGNLFLQTGT